MKKTIKITLFAVLCLAVIISTVLFFQKYNVAVLNPQGEIAEQQRNLIIFTLLLSAVVVVPVFIMLALFSWKYRETNKKAAYRPDWSSNKWLELIWWGVPCVIILVLGIITWRTSHELDPYKSISSTTKPLKIQVVALQWKWLFIYPEQKIASVNLVQFPKDTPLEFQITADAPMNSFWIPSLGSQIYAMSGMSTKLHLIADKTGDFNGTSANISGKGFADMQFIARSSLKTDFDTWVETARISGSSLDMTSYTALAQQGTIKDPRSYVLGDSDLYDKIVMKYMTPMNHTTDSQQKVAPKMPAHDHALMEGM